MPSATLVARSAGVANERERGRADESARSHMTTAAWKAVLDATVANNEPRLNCRSLNSTIGSGRTSAHPTTRTWAGIPCSSRSIAYSTGSSPSARSQDTFSRGDALASWTTARISVSRARSLSKVALCGSVGAVASPSLDNGAKGRWSSRNCELVGTHSNGSYQTVRIRV
jgi:hypothetical protein